MNGFLLDLAQCLRFYSRIHVPQLAEETEPHAAPNFTRMARVVPLAGVLIGTIGAVALAFARGLGLSELAAAAIAITVLVLTTGCFHEDGLADTADSFGGASPERRLEIMADSRIGSYGAIALVLSVLLRIVFLGELLQIGIVLACAALISAAACSRTAALWLSVALPTARSSGAAFTVGRPETESFVVGMILAAIVTGLTIWPTGGFWPMLMGLTASIAVAAWMARLAERHVGGQTGDLAGATQQLAEIAFLAATLMFAELSRG